MNNKGSLVINGVLGVSVIILFVLQFSGEKTAVEEKTDTETTPKEVETVITNDGPAFAGLKIGYVNSDTVTVNYDYSKQLTKDLTAKQASVERKLIKEGEQLQKDIAQFEQSAPIMGKDEYERKAGELYQRKQLLEQKQYQESQKLQDKGYQANYEYVMTTDKYLQRIGKELGYDYVFGYRTGDLVMYANPEYDITRQVIELLNREYNADKKAN